MSVYQSMTGYGQIAWSSGDSPPQYKTFIVSLHKCITAKSRSEVLDKSATAPIEVGQLVLSHVYHYSQSPLFPSKFQLNFDSWYSYHKHISWISSAYCTVKHTCPLDIKPSQHWEKWGSRAACKRVHWRWHRSIDELSFLWRNEANSQLLYAAGNSNQGVCVCAWQRLVAFETNTRSNQGNNYLIRAEDVVIPRRRIGHSKVTKSRILSWEPRMYPSE